MRFRKKPVEIEAIQFLPSQACVDQIMALDAEGNYKITFYINTSEPWRMEIHTLEGAMAAGIGDWIIKGVSGELYPCKPDIFMATYEMVSL